MFRLRALDIVLVLAGLLAACHSAPSSARATADATPYASAAPACGGRFLDLPNRSDAGALQAPLNSFEIGPAFLGQYPRLPFDWQPMDLCGARRVADDQVALECLFPALDAQRDGTNDPLQLVPFRTTLSVRDDVLLTSDPGHPPWNDGTRCMRTHLSELEGRNPRSVVDAALRGTCHEDGAAPREIAATLTYKTIGTGDDARLAVSVVAREVHVEVPLATFWSASLCRGFTSSARDAAGVRCGNTDDGVNVEARAYFVPGQLWARAESSDREAPIPIPCGVRLRFRDSDPCALPATRRFCRPQYKQ
jgi:hypothetical protein